MLEVGNKAPSFTLMGDDGKEYSLDDYRGRSFCISILKTIHLDAQKKPALSEIGTMK